MRRKQKKQIRWAVKRARELLERNACRHETFYKVLNRADVRALHALVELAKKGFVASETKFI